MSKKEYSPLSEDFLSAFNSKLKVNFGRENIKEETASQQIDEGSCGTVNASYDKKKKMEEDQLDPVDPKAVKKDFDDRKDKDIDNDGDVDSSDKYLHKRRQAVSKAIAKEEQDPLLADENPVTENGQDSITESHFKVGDEVVCKASGMEGEVVAVGDEEKEEKYYTVKREDGKTMKYAPSELKLEDEDEDEEDDEEEMKEELKKNKDDPCWKDYVQVGMKKKNGKEVPNCVPKEEVELDEFYDDNYDTGAEEEVYMGLRQLYFIQYAAEEIMDYLEMRGDMDEWFQNKLSNVHNMISGLHSYIEGDKRMQGFGEEVELEESLNNMKKITAAQYKKIYDMHKAADAKGGNFGAHRSIMKDDEHGVIHQVYSHKSHNLPSIWKTADGKKHWMREEVEQVDEAKKVSLVDVSVDMNKLKDKGHEILRAYERRGDIKLEDDDDLDDGNFVAKNPKVAEKLKKDLAKHGAKVHVKVYEQVDEVSKDMKQRYLDKAVPSHYKKFVGRDTTTKQQLDKRRATIQKVSQELKGKKHFSDFGEEVELDEGAKPYISMDDDGNHVMNGSQKIAKSFPANDSGYKAAQAYLKKNYSKLQKEEVEQVDEISSDALRTYKSRAQNRLNKLNKKIDNRTATDKEKYRALGHEHGLGTAAKKLAKRQESAQVEEGRYRGERTPTRKAQPGMKTLKQMSADRKDEKDRADRIKKKVYGNMMGGLKESEQIDEVGPDKAINKYKKRLHQASQSATKVKPMGSTAMTRAAAVRMTRDKMKKEEVELSEKYEVVNVKSINDSGEDKAISYGRKKGYKDAGVIGDSPVKAMVLFHLKPEDKKDLKGANIKAGEQVFRYATRSTIAGDIFPLIKVNLDKGMAYYLTQESSAGDIDEVKFETRGVKLKFARMVSGVAEEVELEESVAAFSKKEYDANNITVVSDKNGYFYINNKSKKSTTGPFNTKRDVMVALQKMKNNTYGESFDANGEVDLEEGAVASSTVRKEIMKNGGRQVGQNDKEIYFTMKGKTHTVPLYKGYVADKDYMKLQDMLGEEVDLEEKAVSQAQQKLMGMALAYKRGEMDDASDEVKKVASSMSEKDLEDFAKTKHDGLPAKKEGYLSAAWKKMKETKKYK